MCDGCLYLFSLTNRTGDSELETLPIVFYLPWMNKARTSMINMRVVIPAASRNDFDLVYCRYRHFHSSPFEMVSKMCLLPSMKTAANIFVMPTNGSGAFGFTIKKLAGFDNSDSCGTVFWNEAGFS